MSFAGVVRGRTTVESTRGARHSWLDLHARRRANTRLVAMQEAAGREEGQRGGEPSLRVCAGRFVSVLDRPPSICVRPPKAD